METYYFGGLNLNKENPSTIYLARKVAGHFEVERWVTADGGASWTSQASSSASDMENARPVAVSGGGPIEVVWWRGLYDTYLDYLTDITSYPPVVGPMITALRR